MKKAFTLSEVLITLGIIGVIAALTIPTLIQNFQTQATVTSLKKVYSILSQAYSLAVQENGDPTNWNLIASSSAPGAINLSTILAPYLKITKDCGNNSGCLPTYYKSLDGSNDYNVIDGYAGNAKMQLIDGSLMALLVRDKGCAFPSESGSLQLNNICADACIDINGFKPPNTFGKDMFRFWITKYSIVPMGGADSASYKFDDNCKAGSGQTCAAWVIQNENLDYIKCPGVLSWSGPIKCP